MLNLHKRLQMGSYNTRPEVCGQEFFACLRADRRGDFAAAVETYDLVEAYPDDKYLPSYLVLAHRDSDYFHVLFAADVAGDNVRVVTAYRPDPDEWEEKSKIRRSS